jgi:hypothetical protein
MDKIFLFRPITRSYLSFVITYNAITIGLFLNYANEFGALVHAMAYKNTFLKKDVNKETLFYNRKMESYMEIKT